MFSGRNFAILVVLLFSLGVSRGEGVHIFPFATNALGECHTSEIGSYDRIEYRDSIVPQEGFQPSQVRLIEESPNHLIGGSTDAPFALSQRNGNALGRRDPTLTPYRATKFDRTSSSDRSPPLV